MLKVKIWHGVNQSIYISNILTKNTNKHETQIASKRHREVINTSVILLVALMRQTFTKSKPMKSYMLNIFGS